MQGNEEKLISVIEEVLVLLHQGSRLDVIQEWKTFESATEGYHALILEAYGKLFHLIEFLPRDEVQP